MQKQLNWMMTSVLAILIAVGAVANSASAIERCLPKECCCSKANAHRTAHGSLTGSTSNCQGNSPCCEFQPLMPFPDMAMVTSSEAPHSQMVIYAVLANPFALHTQQPYTTKLYYKEGNLKIPKPPIYLQNQSFLF